MSYSIAELNQMSQDEFVAVLGAIFEETPVIAYQAWKKRPFAVSGFLTSADGGCGAGNELRVKLGSIHSTLI